MKMLRQLIQDAQTVLRDMSATQRVAVTALILTAAAWLTGAAWFGTRSESAQDVPLAVRVEPTEYKAVEDALRKQGFKVTYNANQQVFMIPAKDEAEAFLFLTSEKLVNSQNVDRANLDQMVGRISFTDTQTAVRMRGLVARGNSIANIIARLDVISEANVVYSDEQRSSLFRGSAPLKATVIVKTKFGRRLDDATAQTIIDLVAFAKGGLEPANVVVSDQSGQRQFRHRDPNSSVHLAANRIELENLLDHRLQAKIEDLVRTRLPGLSDGGAVTIIPTHRVNNDLREIAETVYAGGTATKTRNRTLKERAVAGPPYEPGQRPNVATSGVVDAENAGLAGGNRSEKSRDEKVAEKELVPDRKDTVTKPGPAVEDVTLSVMIQLPYEIEYDESGKMVQATDEYGELLLDPDTRRPMPKKKSVARLTDDELAALRQLFANAAGIAPDLVAEKVFVDQVAWRPPVYSPPGAEPVSVVLLRTIREHFFAIFAASALSAALLFLYIQARQQVHTTLDDEVDEDEVAENLAADLPDEDPTATEMEATRLRVREAVMEDPKRAAMLVRRWMTKE